jgi:hypothetical protein
MSKSILTGVPALVLLLACAPQKPVGVSGKAPSVGALENPAVRQVKTRAPQTMKALLGAMIGSGCQILYTDPNQGLVTFRSNRQSFHWPLSERGSEVQGTLRVVAVSDGLELRLVLSGRVDWPGSEGQRSEYIARCSQALHEEFLDLAERGIQK